MGELVVPSELCRNANGDPVAVIDAAVWMIGYTCEQVGVSDLGQLDVLDVGCGVRFTQAFLDRGVPIKRYVGVDAARAVIDFLRSNVSDPRFDFVHLDAHNELYNPTGRPLEDLTVPELEGLSFDLICLYSVFTHLNPTDYVAMLRLLRRFVRPGGRLLYTLFLNERTEDGYGYIDELSRSSTTPRDSRARPAASSTNTTIDPALDFQDVDQTKPLMYALYSRRHAVELIGGTGWKVLRVLPPNRHLQHHIVCAPNEDAGDPS